jgi:transcriptional regulator with XRE-family HTH domain
MKKTIYTTQQKSLLELLLNLRNAMGVTQAELANQLGVTQAEISKFERGERRLDILQLRAWLQVFGMPLAMFSEALEEELSSKVLAFRRGRSRG